MIDFRDKREKGSGKPTQNAARAPQRAQEEGARSHPLLRYGDSLGLPQRKTTPSKGHGGGKGAGSRPFSEVKTARGEQQAQL